MRVLKVYESGTESRSIPESLGGVLMPHDQALEPNRNTGGGHKRAQASSVVQNLIRVFDNQSAIYDPGVVPACLQAREMASIGGGGDHGDAVEASTHPKPLVDDAIVPASEDRRIVIADKREEYNGSWEGAEEEGTNVGPEVRISGEVDLDDDICVEEPEEEEAIDADAKPKVWRLLARYYSLRVANLKDLHGHFMEVWRIRNTMSFAPLKDNFFIITFDSEGDYKFVARGGPWIKKGVACLIAPFNGDARPSETVLDSIPIWVRFYDVPWKKQTVAYGRFVGSQLGRVEEVDVDPAGLQFSDYLRVPIALPLNKRLQTLHHHD